VGLANRVFGVQQHWRDEAGEALRAHRGCAAAEKRIAAAWTRAQAGSAALYRAQARLANMQKDKLPPQRPCPRPSPRSKHHPRSTTASTTSVIASRRLIDQKNLNGGKG
jgi:hypothetical protein